jgi:uroporphyrinogen decarboxylase
MSGETMGEVPVALWRHFPGDDLEAETLCEKYVEFQRRFDFDLLKYSPSGGYPTVAFGAEIEFYESFIGAPKTKRYRILGLEDWQTLEELDVGSGMLGEMLKSVELLTEEFENEVPFIETVFSPLTIAGKISGDRLIPDLRANPKILEDALQVISRTMVEFSKAVTDAGADGVFFATQFASYDLLSKEEYEQFGMKYDIPILSAVKNSFFNVLHIHGTNTMFDTLVRDYPVHGVNWHDRRTSPSLEEASKKTRLVLLGGLNERETMVEGSKEDVEREVQDAVTQTGSRRLIISPGCIVPMPTPEENYDAAIRAARAS